MNPHRQRVTLVGVIASLALISCGEDGDDSSSADTGGGTAKTIEIVATEYQFSGDPGVQIVAGDTVTFVVTNEGELTHELRVLDTSEGLMNSTDPIPAGETDEVTVTFGETGVYQVICDIDDHLARGQRAQFDVTSG